MFTHLSMTPQDHLTTAPLQLHNPQRAGALVTSIILDGGPHGWVEVNTHSTPVLPKWEEAVVWVARKALHLHEPNHEGNGRSIHNMVAEFHTFHSQAAPGQHSVSRWQTFLM